MSLSADEFKKVPSSRVKRSRKVTPYRRIDVFEKQMGYSTDEEEDEEGSNRIPQQIEFVDCGTIGRSQNRQGAVMEIIRIKKEEPLEMIDVVKEEEDEEANVEEEISIKQEVEEEDEIAPGCSQSSGTGADLLQGDEPECCGGASRCHSVPPQPLYDEAAQSNVGFVCHYCNYVTSSKTLLWKHITTHVPDTSFKSSQYKYTEKFKVNLKKGQAKRNTQEVKKPFKCNLCEYSAAWKTVLDNHMRIHTREKPFKCGICEYSAAEKSKLNRHVRIVHIGERPFKCTFCGYLAAMKSNLDRHIKIVHIGERPFRCTVCGYVAAMKSNLDRHIRSVHIGERPFKCGLCGYSAAQKSDLNHHIRRIHTRGKRPNAKYAAAGTKPKRDTT